MSFDRLIIALISMLGLVEPWNNWVLWAGFRRASGGVRPLPCLLFQQFGTPMIILWILPLYQSIFVDYYAVFRLDFFSEKTRIQTALDGRQAGQYQAPGL